MALLSCLSNPYRARDIEVVNTGIVLEIVKRVRDTNDSESNTGQYLTGAGEIFFKVFNYKFLDNDSSTAVKALVRMNDGKNYLVNYPDANLKSGDCIEALLVDGNKQYSYAANCPAELEAYNKSFNLARKKHGPDAL